MFANKQFQAVIYFFSSFFLKTNNNKSQHTLKIIETWSIISKITYKYVTKMNIIHQ